MSSFAGSKIMVLGLFELPLLTDKMPNLSSSARTAHVTLAILSFILVIGHILMALKHHFIDRDTVLKSMAPHRAK